MTDTKFDAKMYVETFSGLHASENTLAEVMEKTAVKKRRKNAARPAIIPASAMALMIFIVSTLFIPFISLAGSGMSGIWVFNSTQREIRQMGFNYPRQLGLYRVNEHKIKRLHRAPAGSDNITARLQPEYTFMNLVYEKNDRECLSLNFGSMDDPLWTSCFGYDKTSGRWEGALDPDSRTCRDDEGSVSYISSLEEHFYKGCTIYLYDWRTDCSPSPSGDGEPPIDHYQDANAVWADPEAGICFSLNAESTLWETSYEGDDTYIRNVEGVSGKELLSYVKTIIDSCR